MLTPPNCCIQVAPHAYRATHCFGTSSRISGRHSVGFGRVLLAGGEHKRRPSLKGNDGRKGRAAGRCESVPRLKVAFRLLPHETRCQSWHAREI